MFVCCGCCVLSGRGLCDGPIIRSEESRSPTECGVSECDREASAVRKPSILGALEPCVEGRGESPIEMTCD